MKRSISIACFLCFVAGVALTNSVWAVYAELEIWVVGSPTVCRESFPRYHSACIYSRPGFGEQGVTLEIDDEPVLEINDFAPGDLAGDVFWDSKARFVTFYAKGLGHRTFDAEDKIEIAGRDDTD